MPKVFVHPASSALSRALIPKLLTRTPNANDDGEDDDDEQAEKTEQKQQQETYHVVVAEAEKKRAKDEAHLPGSASRPLPGEGVETVALGDKEALRKALLACDALLLDVSRMGQAEEVERAVALAQMLHEAADEFVTPKTVVLVSTVMTWAKTKPVEDASEDAALLEDEYRRRRPHRNFKAHADAEKLVVKLGKKSNGKLQTYVVAAGLTYGAGEGVLHGLFRAAWSLARPALPVFGGAEKVLPMIHLHDLADVVLCTMENNAETPYVLGVDESTTLLGELTAAISQKLGPGGTKAAAEEDMHLMEDMSQLDCDMLTLNLRLEGGAALEFPFEWQCREGPIEAMPQLIREFRTTRRLAPVRIALYGPPGVGKTTFARRLCQHYKLHHVERSRVIQETMKRLRASAAVLDNPAEDADLEQAETDKATLETVEAYQADNDGKYEEVQILKWFREMLASKSCRNQGYVLDGYPDTEEMAKELFQPLEEEPDEELEPDQPDPRLMPEYVLALEAPDAFLKERIMALPEAEVAGTGNAELAFVQRLQQYRSTHTDDATVLNFYDFHEVHPVTLGV